MCSEPLSNYTREGAPALARMGNVTGRSNLQQRGASAHRFPTGVSGRLRHTKSKTPRLSTPPPSLHNNNMPRSCDIEIHGRGVEKTPPRHGTAVPPSGRLAASTRGICDKKNALKLPPIILTPPHQAIPPCEASANWGGEDVAALHFFSINSNQSVAQPS